MGFVGDRDGGVPKLASVEMAPLQVRETALET